MKPALKTLRRGKISIKKAAIFRQCRLNIDDSAILGVAYSSIHSCLKSIILHTVSDTPNIIVLETASTMRMPNTK